MSDNNVRLWQNVPTGKTNCISSVTVWFQSRLMWPRGFSSWCCVFMSWHSVSMPSNGSALPVSIRETMPKVDHRKLLPLQRDVLAVDVVQLLFYSTFALYSKPLLMLSVSICYLFLIGVMISLFSLSVFWTFLVYWKLRLAATNTLQY